MTIEAGAAELEQARADFYAVTSTLLLQPPSDAFLDALAGADSLAAHEGEQDRLACCWEKLVLTARLIEPAAVRDEFAALFTDATSPAVNPYGSWYLTGFLMEKPLARLRADLGTLGLARAAHSHELEDHLGALLETMRVLVQQQPLSVQRRFLHQHIASWSARCTADIRQQPQANFYGVLADFIDAFIDLEVQAFAMDQNHTGEPA